MKPGWTEVALGEVCDIQIGKTPPRANPAYWDGDLPWLSISDMNQGRELSMTSERITAEAAQELNCREVAPGTVLLSFKLSIGKVGITSVPMYTNEAIAHLPISVEHLDPTYLYWALRSVPLTGGADRAAMGSTLNKSKLAKIRFPLPPLEEQKRIAAILDKADELQGKRRAAIAHLDSLTQAIFLDMFGDPDSADSVWPIAPLADLISPDDRVNYGVVQPGPAVGDGVPMVRVSDFTGGTIRHGDIKQISSEIESKYRRSRLRGDEVLLSCVGTIGEVAVATIAERGFNIARAVTRIPTGESLRAQYLAHLLRTKSLQRRLTSELRTVAQPTLNIKQIKELSVPLPPIEMQQTFEAAAAHSARVARLLLDAESCSRDLAASLQVRAFRGEL